MDVKMRTELGIKVEDPGKSMWDKRTENYANLPGHDMSNSNLDITRKEASAVKPSQAREMFRVEGNSVNILA